jgi:hypothetical protein
MIAEQNVKIVTLLKKSMCRNKFQWVHDYATAF